MTATPPLRSAQPQQPAPAADTSTRHRSSARTRRPLAIRALRSTHDYLGALVALIAIVIALTVTQNGFMTVANMQNVLQTNAPLLLASIGMTIVVVSGGIDLSVGAMMALSEEFLVPLINHAHLNPLLSVILAVLMCGVVGAVINGVAIGWLKLNFFVCTLATMILIQGVVLVVSSGNTTVISSSWLQKLGNKDVGIVPVSVLVCLGVLVVAWFILRMTTFGRAAYAVGGNHEAARLSGIAVPVVLTLLYMLSAMCGALAGVLDAARLDAATPTAGSTIALTTAAAVLLGGASLAGGVGKLTGTVIGVLVLAFLSNGVDLLGISAYWQDVVTGVVLFAAILLDRAHKSGVFAGLRLRPRAPTKSKDQATSEPVTAIATPMATSAST